MVTDERPPRRDRFHVESVDPRRTRELRRSVLRPEHATDAALPGDDLPDAVHVAAFEAEALGFPTVVSTCFIYEDPCPERPEVKAWHLRQMATSPDSRGQGAGEAVIAFVVDYLRERRDVDLLWCNARETAVGFYERQGFTGIGELFTDERHAIPHLRMLRPLATAAASRADRHPSSPRG